LWDAAEQDPVIALCWLTFLGVWIVSAFFTKRTAGRCASSMLRSGMVVHPAV
jgi:hypothetical protein